MGPCGPIGPSGPAGPCGPAGPAMPGVPGSPLAPVSPFAPGRPCGPCGPGGPCWPCGPTAHWVELAVAVADLSLSSYFTYQVALPFWPLSSFAGNQTWNEYCREPSTNDSIQTFWSDWPNTRSSEPTRSSLPVQPLEMLSPAWMYSSPPGRLSAT